MSACLMRRASPDRHPGECPKTLVAASPSRTTGSATPNISASFGSVFAGMSQSTETITHTGRSNGATCMGEGSLTRCGRHTRLAPDTCDLEIRPAIEFRNLRAKTIMPKVFISHAISDSIDGKTVGLHVCEYLESSGIECWIAPRNIEGGSDWGASIIKAIPPVRSRI